MKKSISLFIKHINTSEDGKISGGFGTIRGGI